MQIHLDSQSKEVIWWRVFETSAELPIDLSHANCKSLGTSWIDSLAFGSLVALDVALPIETTVSVHTIVTLYIIYYIIYSNSVVYHTFTHIRDSETICEASTAGNWPITGNAAGLEAARRRHQWAVDSQRSTLSGKLRHVSKPFFESLQQQKFPNLKTVQQLGPWYLISCHSFSLLKITQNSSKKPAPQLRWGNFENPVEQEIWRTD